MGVNKQVKSLGYLSSRYLQITQQTSAGHKGIPVFIRRHLGTKFIDARRKKHKLIYVKWF